MSDFYTDNNLISREHLQDIFFVEKLVYDKYDISYDHSRFVRSSTLCDLSCRKYLEKNLETFIHDFMKATFNIIGLSETRLDEGNVSLFNFPAYGAPARDRSVIRGEMFM